MAEDANPKPKGRSARAAVGNLVTKVVVYPLAFVASVLVDRTLGARDRGLFAFLLLVGNFVLPLLTFGLGGSVTYFISAGKWRTEDVALTTLLVGFFQGALSAGITYILWYLGLLGATGADTAWRDLLPILVIAPLQGVQLMAGRILFGEARFGASNWLNIARAALSPLLLFGLVVLGRMGLWGAVCATIVVNVLMTIGWVLAVARSGIKLTIHRPFFTEGLSYGLKLWIGDVATRANLRLDQFLLGIFAPAAALGNYSVAIRISEFIWIGVDSVTPVLFNRLAGTKEERERIALTAQVHRTGMLAMVAVAMPAGVVGYVGIPWMFGEEFRHAAVLFELMLPGTVAMFTAKVLAKYFAASARPDLAGRLGLLSGVAGAMLYFALIPLGATYGAAIASTLAYVGMSGAALLFYKRTIAPEPGRLFAFERGDLSWAWDQLAGRLRRRRAG